MGVLEIIAEQRLGTEALQAHPGLRVAFTQLESTVAGTNAAAEQVEKERICSIIELCFEYDRETDADEKENILRTLEEISSNQPLEMPSSSLEDWEESLAATDPDYDQAKAEDDARIQRFLKKYFSLRAAAGFATQADVAEKSGLSRSYIAVIESGEHFPQQKTLQKLAKAFSVDVTGLF